MGCALRTAPAAGQGSPTLRPLEGGGVCRSGALRPPPAHDCTPEGVWGAWGLGRSLTDPEGYRGRCTERQTGWGGVSAPHMHRVRYLNNFSGRWSTGRGVVEGTWGALRRYHSP